MSQQFEMEDQSFYDLKDCLDSKDFESCSIEELEFNFSEEIGLSLNEEQNDRQSKNQQRKKKANQKIIEKKKILKELIQKLEVFGPISKRRYLEILQPPMKDMVTVSKTN